MEREAADAAAQSLEAMRRAERSNMATLGAGRQAEAEALRELSGRDLRLSSAKDDLRVFSAVNAAMLSAALFSPPSMSAKLRVWARANLLIGALLGHCGIGALGHYG